MRITTSSLLRKTADRMRSTIFEKSLKCSAKQNLCLLLHLMLMESNFFEKTPKKKAETGNAVSPEMLEFEKLLAEKPDAAKSLIALLKTV